MGEEVELDGLVLCVQLEEVVMVVALVKLREQRLANASRYGRLGYEVVHLYPYPSLWILSLFLGMPNHL